MLPPGRLRLPTNPLLTGSPPLTNTIGIAVVAAMAARVAETLAMMTAACAHEIGRQPWKPIGLIVSPAKVDGNVLALDESGLLQPLSKRGDKLRRAGSR